MRHLPRCVFRQDSFGDKWRLADSPPMRERLPRRPVDFFIYSFAKESRRCGLVTLFKDEVPDAYIIAINMFDSDLT